MFSRSSRGLLDFCVATLCLWAAYYHTPAGALLRKSGAWVLGAQTTARPLLSYYGAPRGTAPTVGVRNGPNGHAPVLTAIPDEVPADEALGYGIYASLERLTPTQRQQMLENAGRWGANLDRLKDDRTGPKEATALVRAMTERLDSQDAAVLAILCGFESARYARDRVLAEGGALTLERLAEQLPPEYEGQGQLAGQALALGTAYGLSWPVSSVARITSPFGMRQHPILGEPRMHTGVDISVPEGTSVHAAAKATVRRASEDPINGRVLILDHGHGVTTAYCHNSELLVSVGQIVERGQVISRSGSTGRSTGPHLHFQLELSDGPVDPLHYRRGGGAVQHETRRTSPAIRPAVAGRASPPGS